MPFLTSSSSFSCCNLADKHAAELFEIVAENSEVEWVHVKYEKLYTYHSKGKFRGWGEPSGESIRRKRKLIREVKQSHPNSIKVPRGYGTGTQDRKTGSIATAVFINSFSPKTLLIFTFRNLDYIFVLTLNFDRGCSSGEFE